LIKRSKKRLTIVDERVEEIRKALQMCNGKYEIQLIDFPKKRNLIFREIMADVLIQCGNFIMVPNQLTRLGDDSGK